MDEGIQAPLLLRKPRLTRIAQISLLVAVYFITARLGLMLGAVSGFATLVWPPTGISLAALIIFGFDLWPGIALGAFLANASLGAPLGVVVGISAGNTLEALLGAYFLKRLGFGASLENLASVVGLVVPVAFLTTLVSATLGVGSLLVGGKILPSAVGPTWLAWWLGDVMGNLIVAPFLFVWSVRPSFSMEPGRVVEAALLAAGAFLGSLIIFTDLPILVISGKPIFAHVFFIFPVMMVLAVRLGQRAVVTANLVLAVIVIYATAMGTGRFWTGSLTSSLLEAQVFLAVLIVSKLVLAAALAERKRLYFEAKAAIGARDEFMSIASHELKTPLTSLKLQLQLASRGIDPERNLAPSPASLAKTLRISNGQVDRLTILVEDLLDVTKIGAGKLNLRLDKINLCEVVRNTVDRLSEVAAAAQCTLQMDLLPEVTGYWDLSRLEQVVANLLTNAIKYAPGKPVTVIVRRDERAATLTVEDLGPGIAKEQQAKIFERFERATTSRNISGLGLGLFIVSQIARAHRGSVRVQSEVGQGASFIVELPLDSR